MSTLMPRLGWFSLLCALACASAAGAAAPSCRASEATAPRYLLASQADIVALLPAPPAENSDAEQRDLQAVLAAQREARARGTIPHAIADATASCGRFADVLGPAFIDQRDNDVLMFLDRAAREGEAILGPAKSYWKRERPFAVSGLVTRLGDMAPGWKGSQDLNMQADASSTAGCVPEGPAEGQHVRGPARPPAQAKRAQQLAHSSYPSGHAAYATVCAILLADIIPERRAQLFARADDFAHSRLVLGAHFPTDLTAGRIGGTVASMLMMQNAQFQLDYAEARKKLREVLGLPQAVDDATRR